MDASNEQSQLDPGSQHYTTGYSSLSIGLVSAVVVVFLYIFWRETRNEVIRKKINAPGPKPWPLIGNLLDARKFNGIHLLLSDYIEKYGKVFSFVPGGMPAVVIADPDILKRILVKDFWNFRNRFLQVKASGTIGKSVFLAQDETWKRIRTTLTPSFSAKKMKGMVSMIEESLDILMKKIEKVADTGWLIVQCLHWLAILCFRVLYCALNGCVGDQISLFSKGDA